MTRLIFTVLGIIVLAGFCSMLEAAIFTISLSKAKVLAREGSIGAKALLKVKENMARSIFMLVVLTNVATVLGSLLIGHQIADYFHDPQIGIASGVITFFIILLGELIPKTIGENYAEKIAPLFAPVVLLCAKIFRPIAALYTMFASLFVHGNEKTVSEDELKALSEVSHLEGSIDEDEKEIILNTFKLNDLTAKDIMTPQTVVESLPGDMTVQEAAKNALGDNPFSRMPVYGKDINEIIGVCSTKTLFVAATKGNTTTLVKDLCTKPILVSEKTRADHLLRMFKRTKQHFAIVRDEFGGFSGIVTLEDVLEVLVGEIMDESDEHQDMREVAKEKSKRKEEKRG